MSAPSSSFTSDRFDLAVIGAGVVGCAIARRFVLDGAKVVVLDKAAEVLDGASKANSAILHTGFDAPPGSVEAACIAEGYREYHAIHARLGLPLDPCGALVLAWSEEEEAALPALMAQARDNGVTDAAPLTRDGLLAHEPQLAPQVRAGFRIPGEALIDPWSAPHAYLLQALTNGAALRCGAEVLAGDFDGDDWRLRTTAGEVRAGHVVNAAGLYGDVVDERLLGRRDFAIRPRKGQFVVYDKPAAALTRHILLPVPSKLTKGIVICRTVWGNLLVGPTAEEQKDRATASLDPATLAGLQARGATILPALAGHEVTAAYAGLRPATEEKHYRIRLHAGRNCVTVGGIRSTGLSAALGIAHHVAGLVAGSLPGMGQPLAAPDWPRMPDITEAGARDWQRPGHGGILCHCELVTRREVAAALDGPLGARTLAGVKRRTRAMMGRCQGFYCGAALAQATAGRLAQPMAEPLPGQGDG